MTTPTPQKIRRQRRRLLIGTVLTLCWGAAMAALFVCSWLWRVLVG